MTWLDWILVGIFAVPYLIVLIAIWLGNRK